MKKIFATALSFLVFGCGTQQGTTFVQGPEAITSMTNVVTGIYPPDISVNSTSLPANIVILVDFLAPIDPTSVDAFTFRVENENDKPQEGEITISPDAKQLSFARRVNGQPAPWDPGTYTVYTRFLKDLDGNVVGDRAAQFSVRAIESQGTGDFKVANVTPTQDTFFQYLLGFRPDAPVTVEFTLPVSPNSPVCDTPVLRNAIQLINVDIGDPNNLASVPPMSAQICLVCSAPGYCNRIVAKPIASDPFRDNSLLLIVVRPSSNFVGITSNGTYQTLANTVVKSRFVSFNYFWP